MSWCSTRLHFDSIRAKPFAPSNKHYTPPIVCKVALFLLLASDTNTCGTPLMIRLFLFPHPCSRYYATALAAVSNRNPTCTYQVAGHLSRRLLFDVGGLERAGRSGIRTMTMEGRGSTFSELEAGSFGVSAGGEDANEPEQQGKMLNLRKWACRKLTSHQQLHRHRLRHRLRPQLRRRLHRLAILHFIFAYNDLSSHSGPNMRKSEGANEEHSPIPTFKCYDCYDLISIYAYKRLRLCQLFFKWSLFVNSFSFWNPTAA
ncbi:hypothetical protein GALMADRAFT_562132 [Galerina marginata CBS 339.88]|uniref:Uncharacterized protein n=1 Tax=Galerina marginata (strain CBS 339.88) TaxID=685588 RepID=A0A067SV50_GALM3|nr:hypothetical protein GALMADRAFT_562132 [Galerina marginata CBS 339.88]